MPVEPDEMPLTKPAPEIKQPYDPKEPEIPEEDNENLPQELPPGEANTPEILPKKINQCEI